MDAESKAEPITKLTNARLCRPIDKIQLSGDNTHCKWDYYEMSPDERAGEPDPYRPSEIERVPPDMADWTVAEIAAEIRAHWLVHDESVDYEARRAEANRRLLADIRAGQQEVDAMSPWRRLITGILDRANSHR